MHWIKKIASSIKDATERIKVSSDDFKMMQLKSRKYDDILSTIYIGQSVSDYIDCKDGHGNIIYRFPKGKEYSITVDSDKILHIIGIDIAK